MVIKSFSLGLFKQAPTAASGHTKPIPSHGMICFLCPNSCLGPFNGWSNILIVRQNKHSESWFCSPPWMLALKGYKNCNHLLLLSPGTDVTCCQCAAYICFCGFAEKFKSLHRIFWLNKSKSPAALWGRTLLPFNSKHRSDALSWMVISWGPWTSWWSIRCLLRYFVVGLSGPTDWPPPPVAASVTQNSSIIFSLF